MSLHLSATFPSTAAAASAMRLLRQMGVSAELLGRAAPVRPPHPAGFDETGLYTGAQNAALPHALVHGGAPRAHTSAPGVLRIRAEPDELAAAQRIVCSCGGALR